MTSELTIADLLTSYLREAGLWQVFGYPGESIVDFMEAARIGGLTVVSAAREASAAFMAEGAAMATGRPGAVVSTLGPGSTAVLNGVASAQLDRVPLIAVSGQVDSRREQYWTHQLIDHDLLFSPVTKLTARLEPASADTVIRRALRTAVAERPGAVHLTVGHDVFAKPVTEDGFGDVRLPPLDPAAAGITFYPDTHSARLAGDVTRVLAGAARPVLLAGAGAVRGLAGPELAALASSAGIPVIVGAMAKGVIPEEHPYFAGVLDMAGHRVIGDLLASADLIITAGFDPVELITPWRLTVPVLHVDAVPNVDQIYRADHEIVGHIPSALAWLRENAGPGPRWTEAEIAAHQAALRAAWQAGYDPAVLNPSEVVEITRAATPAGTVVTADVGSHKIMAGQAWTASAPRQALITNGLSAMGFGLPAAIGASVALGSSGGPSRGPGAPVVSLCGDGGFAMTATELSVAASRKLPIVVVVFGDGNLNRIVLHQQQAGLPLTGTAVPPTDIPALAEALGCDGVRVSSSTGLEKALSGAFAAGRTRPLVIEARIGTSQYDAQF
ncbi:MAG: thiamine pyrophosphate-binding protein [Actinomycetia bacterium]|nr:thiamine pyrophosphate-binding protein [Actinomycetes bacterium]